MKRAAAALIVAASIAGCGSSTLSDRQLRADATQVCRVTLTRLDRISVPSSPAGGEAFLRRGTAALRPEIKALHKLAAPRQIGQTFSTALDALTFELADMELADTRLSHGADPAQTFRTLASRIDGLETRANEAFRSLQIPACIER